MRVREFFGSYMASIYAWFMRRFGYETEIHMMYHDDIFCPVSYLVISEKKVKK